MRSRTRLNQKTKVVMKMPRKETRWKHKWNARELDILENKTSTANLTEMSKMLKRTKNSVATQRHRQGVPCYRKSTDDLSMNQVCKMMGVTSRVVWRWQRKGLKVRKTENGLCSIQQDDLVRFLHTHQDVWDSARMTDDTLVWRFKWFQEKYEIEKKDPPRPHHWSELETARLKTLYEMGKSAKEISIATGRSISAVKSKIWYLKMNGKLMERDAEASQRGKMLRSYGMRKTKKQGGQY